MDEVIPECIITAATENRVIYYYPIQIGKSPLLVDGVFEWLVGDNSSLTLRNTEGGAGAAAFQTHRCFSTSRKFQGCPRSPKLVPMSLMSCQSAKQFRTAAFRNSRLNLSSDRAGHGPYPTALRDDKKPGRNLS